jgi:anaerobic selenocysteine-containing dehydrogenase
MSIAEEPVATVWKQSACPLCTLNCGIEIRLGVDGRTFDRIRGDKAHPISQGYTCEKALRLDHYQNGQTDRVLHPMRRRADGTFERIDWDTAIREVAARLVAMRDTHGGASIFYYGGGAQGNHLPGAYSAGTRRAIGSRYRSNALAQEKTGQMYVNGKVVGAYVHGDFEHAEVSVFVGKNPWQSHGFPRTRTVLKEIARDPERTMIVLDPRVSETAELADIHLAVRPGSDAWALAAMLGVIAQENLVNHKFLAEYAHGAEEVLAVLQAVDVAAHCAAAGLDEELVRTAARRIAGARTMALFEDLGVQMNHHSTLVSYLDTLLWAVTGHFGGKGSNNAPLPFVSLGGSGGGKVSSATSPVVGAAIIAGLVPCNVIPDEILTDHDARYRAMIVEAANPAHSLADSKRMREALAALDLLVVIDVAMTETARLAHYVLPTSTQFEKPEATFFNFEYPHNAVHLRQPVLEPPTDADVLTEAEIHTRLLEAMGEIGEADYSPLRDALAGGGVPAFTTAFLTAAADKPALGAYGASVLYRTLGESLPEGMAPAAAMWGPAQQFALRHPSALAGAEFGGGDELFDAIVSRPSGVVFSVENENVSFDRIKGGHLNLVIPELLAEVAALVSIAPPQPTAEFPYVLSAGERRSSTANTLYRSAGWRKNDTDGALRISTDDGARLGFVTGSRAQLSTPSGSVEVTIEVNTGMRAGHISLPNGFGLDQPAADGTLVQTGIAPNELTSSGHRDPIAGTPFHKWVPANLVALAPAL